MDMTLQERQAAFATALELGFCATGSGGGIDNSCGKEEGGGKSEKDAMNERLAAAGVGSKEHKAANEAARKAFAGAKAKLTRARDEKAASDRKAAGAAKLDKLLSRKRTDGKAQPSPQQRAADRKRKEENMTPKQRAGLKALRARVKDAFGGGSP